MLQKWKNYPLTKFSPVPFTCPSLSLVFISSFLLYSLANVMLIFLTPPPIVWRDRAWTKSFWQAGVKRMYHIPSWTRSSEMNVATLFNHLFSINRSSWSMDHLIVQKVVMTLGFLPFSRCLLLIACPTAPLWERAFQPFIFLFLHLISSQFILVCWSSLKILWILFVFLSYFIFFHFSLSDIFIVRIREGFQ